MRTQPTPSLATEWRTITLLVKKAEQALNVGGGGSSKRQSASWYLSFPISNKHDRCSCEHSDHPRANVQLLN